MFGIHFLHSHKKTWKTFLKVEFALIHLCKDIDEKVFAKLLKALKNSNE